MMARACMHKGFTLLEIAVVLFIVGLLIAGFIGPVDTQIEARDRHSTRATLEQAVDAVYGFAVTHGRLPCPDQDGDGLSDPAFDASDVNSADCDVGSGNGFLPWAELGVEGGDAWRNRLLYRVRHPHFTWPAADTTCNGNTQGEFDLCTTGNLTLRTRGDDAATAGVSEGKFEMAAATPDNVVAVVLSHGRNGFGAVALDGTPRGAVPASNDDEAENADDDGVFMMRRYSRAQNGCSDTGAESSPLCEFDDLLLPVSRTILNSRMVNAGRLP
jgi:prepilin-type N-terminal cleavage/methylation domain-containing protein